MNKVILYVVAFAALCLMIAGCSDETFNQESGNGAGYLHLALGSVNVELCSISRADAGSLPEEFIPETDEFMVDIEMNGKSVEGFPKPYTEITGEIELKAGSYSVIAYCGDNNGIQDKPYFYGSSTVQINPGKPTETEVNAVLANAMLTPAVSESLQKHYSEWTLNLKVGEISMKLADKENANGYLFVKAGTSVSAVFEGTNILGNENSHEWEVVSSVNARTKYVIQCDPDIPVFSFGLNAFAEHTTNDLGELNGTKVSLTFGDLSGVPVSLISELNVTLENAEGELVRSYSTDDFNSAGEMLVENNWSYLPQGDYTLRYSYTIDGEKVSDENTEAKIVSMPLPTFNAVVSAQTSYSVYQSDGVAAANNTDGSSIFNVTASASISTEILNNEKYANLLSVTYSLDTGESTTEESPIFENLKWGKRTLTAFVMFDKGSATSSVDCDVTGIPYYVSFNGNTNPENWILSNNGKCGDRLTLKKSEAYALSPKFHIPMDLEITVVLNAYAYGGSWPYNYKPTVSIHPSEVGINSTVVTTLKGSIEVPGTASFNDISTTFTLTDNVGKICIYTKGNISGSIGTGDIGVVCDHFSVQYK